MALGGQSWKDIIWVWIIGMEKGRGQASEVTVLGTIDSKCSKGTKEGPTAHTEEHGLFCWMIVTHTNDRTVVLEFALALGLEASSRTQLLSALAVLRNMISPQGEPKTQLPPSLLFPCLLTI